MRVASAGVEQRLGNIVIGTTRDGLEIYAKQIKAVGAMTALLKDAIQPNLVQTMEGTPCFIHGGPFANIAHGLKHADYVVTEAGFGADLGAEKFLDIKMRKSGLKPDGVVIVSTLRALKLHGGAEQANLSHENIDAVKKGFANVRRHVENTRKFGVPVMVALNSFSADTDAERDAFFLLCKEAGISAVESDHWARGGEGAEAFVVVCGDIMTMPGLPRKPAAENIYVREDGEIEGLF